MFSRPAQRYYLSPWHKLIFEAWMGSFFGRLVACNDKHHAEPALLAICMVLLV